MTGYFVTSAAASAADAAWTHDTIGWQQRSAQIRADGDGYRLTVPGNDPETVAIAPQAMTSDTASMLFDGLFALAQQEMHADRVIEIRDDAFDNGRPLSCDCYQTGAKWPYVWTRDVSYSADLALARLDPERMRRTLRFKLSEVRATGLPQGLYVAQDTGSGGSWPVSSDRVAWFLGARHLLDDAAFAQQTWRALRDTLAQDRAYVFDAELGLYRGETSFLDWREQSYPAWTADAVTLIAESFALSTNVLHYQALRLAAEMADRRHDASAADYRAQAAALGKAIDRHFWNAHRGMYMSYIGAAAHPVAFEAYDLLGMSLAALSGAMPEARARQSLANYPASAAGSPVIWPQQPGIAIYHNRAIWPFVSAYALKAARKLDMPARIDHELRSLMRGAALAGSNMENYEFVTQAAHVDDGALSGPVVNSPRQLWSVAGYLDMVLTGVFGVEADGTVAPKIPVALVPMLFGDRDVIRLRMSDRSIALRRPRALSGNLLVAGKMHREGKQTTVQLEAKTVAASPVVLDAPQFAPMGVAKPVATRNADGWHIAAADADTLYVDGKRVGAIAGTAKLPLRDARQCVSVTRSNTDGVESLHSPTLCIGDVAAVDGDWPRRWTAPRDGRYRATLRYDNPTGPLNTGVTAAVKWLQLRCGDAAEQRSPVVMPYSRGEQSSTTVSFSATAGQRCTITLAEGVNMSALRHFARYTGGRGGVEGPLNDARIGALEIAPSP
ncbi:MAG: Six-hairpin glycosidase-like protein [Luteimonas sp.]